MRQSLSLFCLKIMKSADLVFFKFNNSLLEDKNFVEELKKNIEQYNEKYGCYDDKRLYWEMIKMEIRSFTLFFSKRRSKQRRNEEELLQRELCNLQRKVGADPSEENVSEFLNEKFKLNQLSLLKTRGPRREVKLAGPNTASAILNISTAWRKEITILSI